MVQAKRDKEVRTKYHTSCTLGGYHTLANMVDFAQKTKTIYSKAVQALQKGYYVNLSLSTVKLELAYMLIAQIMTY